MIISAITLDFADTLYPHRPRELDRILGGVADYLTPHLPPFAFEDFRAKQLEVRTRQFAENRPTLHENDLVARMRETILHLAPQMAPNAEHIEALANGAVEAYGQAFVRAMEMPPFLPDLLAALAARLPLVVISNYPVSAPIIQTLERDGLTRFLRGIVVSADVGFVKPHPLLFQTALNALDSPPPGEVLHIGDDWDADILGAAAVGLQTIYTRQWRDEPDKHYNTGSARPLTELNDLRELPAFLGRLTV